MSDWETVPTKVTEKTIRGYADLKDGYAGGAENPTTNLAQLDAELSRANLHPVAKQALTEERARLMGGDGGWEPVTLNSPSNSAGRKSADSGDGWEAVGKRAPAVPFESGSAFKDTKAMIPSMDDISNTWDTLKKQWANRHNTPMTPEIAQKMMEDEHAAGSAVFDIVGAIPAMLAGGVHGVVDGVRHGDATQGLKTAGETMTKLLPSTLMGNEGDQKLGGYTVAMAPLTAMMDTLNAIPQGYGEMLHTGGYDKAAAQTTDAGKLAIMTVFGAKGAREMYKSITGKEAKSAKEAAEKLEKIRALVAAKDKEAEAAKTTSSPEATKEPLGLVPKEEDIVLSRQEQQEKVRQQMDADNAGKRAQTYPLEQDPTAPLPYEMSLVPKGEEQPLPAGGREIIPTMEEWMTGNRGVQRLDHEFTGAADSLNMPSVPDRLALVPKDEPGVPTTEAQKPLVEGNKAEAEAKAADDALQQQYVGTKHSTDTMRSALEHAQKVAEEKRAAALQRVAERNKSDPAYAEMQRRKEADYAAMEAQRELDFNETARRIEEQGVRRAFLDRANMDFQYARDGVKDKSLMSQDKTLTMRALLRRGDINGVLAMIAEHHPNSGYRELATYLNGKLGDLKIKMSDQSIMKLGDRDVTGYYDPSTHTVGLSSLGGTSPHTILHEMTHALTSKFINERGNDVRVMGLKNLYNQLAKEGKMGDFPGIVNPKEFVAEAFSNPRFQEHLKGINMNGKSVWNRFVDGVKSIFGLKGDTPVANAFEHAMDLGKQIVEAQSKAAAMEQFKKVGLPNKLADLMAQKPRDARPEIVQHEAVRTIASKLPGLDHAVSDFAFYDKPIEEIVQMAREATDIPNTLVEKFAQQMQGGALFESLKTRNPVVKYTYERLTRAFQEAAHNVKANLTDPKTGIKSYMRNLNPSEKGEIHAAMMLHEGQRELTSTELASAGFNEKQIAYYNKQRELDNQFYTAINERRVAAGLTPMDKRVAHIAGRFMGDFAHMVFKDGKVVGRISGSTAWELKKVREYIKAEHPEWEFGKQEYNKIGHGVQAKDRFAGLMEAINFIEKADGDVKALMDSYKGYMQKDAVNYLNATRHAKAKVKEAGGIIGSEGNKPWMDTIKNAEEGMKAQLSYFEQGYQWMAMEKAVGDLKKVLGDEQVAKNNPNAAAYSQKYTDHAMGRNQGLFSDAANWTASKIGELLGVGHTNLMKLNNNVKHLIMQKFMGVFNVPFTITQLSQPFQTQPAMIRLIRSRGLEFSTAQAQLRASETYLKSMLSEHGAAKMDPFERAAVKYADEMSIFDVKMADHTKDINASPLKENLNKMADLNITAPEHLTRGMTFLFYSHALKEAGVPARDIFGAAENMTNMSMVNYHRIERPMGYAKLGWLGDVASTLTRYKHNQWSQLAMYTREGGKAGGSYSPLATFLGTSLAFGGAMGFFAYNESDAIYQLFSEHVLKKPDSLSNVVVSSGMPEVMSHGMFSALGMDMTTRFSNANALPDSIPAAIMPYGSAVMDMATSAGRYVWDPTNSFKGKQMVKAWAPQSAQGLIENHLFTEKTRDGRNMYINSTDGPNLGKGRVERSEDDMNMRAFGFRNIRESKELTKNYSDSQIEKQHSNIVDGLFSKTTYGILGGNMSQSDLAGMVRKAAEHGESPDAFVGKLVKWSQDRQLTQAQQQLLRNAQKGFQGAFNIKESRK